MAEVAPQIVGIRMPDGTVKKWDMANEQKPDTMGNNASRNGFAFNPGNGKKYGGGHSLGRFFQETIKKGFISVLKRIHKEIGRYDKTPYVYDDPRLKNLDHVIKEGFKAHLNDNDAERKQEIAGLAGDIAIFHMKEDVFYRIVILKIVQDIVKDAIQNPDNYALTDFEQYLYEKFNGMGNFSCIDLGKIYPTFEQYKDDPDCITRWKAIHNPTGKQVV